MDSRECVVSELYHTQSLICQIQSRGLTDEQILDIIFQKNEKGKENAFWSEISTLILWLFRFAASRLSQQPQFRNVRSSPSTTMSGGHSIRRSNKENGCQRKTTY